MYSTRILTKQLIYVTKWRRYFHNKTMKSNSESVSRYFVLGLGVGTGVAIVLYVTKRLFKQNDINHRLVLALNDVSKEISELRGVMVVHGRSTTVFNEKPRSLRRSENIHSKLLTVGGEEEYTRDAKPEESSSDEDDFFDMQDTQENSSENEISNEESSPDINIVIKECDELLDQNNISTNEREIQLLEDLLIKSPENVEVLWRLARAYKNKACAVSEEKDPEKRKELVQKGIEYIQEALEIDENNGDAHKWCAILLGIGANQEGHRGRIDICYKYKHHITNAIKLKPKDPTVHHLLGRWSYEIAMLSWWQRQAAAIFIGELPMSTIEEALSNFDEAEKLSPGFLITNSLFIGKCYKQLGDLNKASEWMRKSLELPVKDDEDKQAAEEATSILQNM